MDQVSCLMIYSADKSAVPLELSTEISLHGARIPTDVELKIHKLLEFSFNIYDVSRKCPATVLFSGNRK